MRDVLPKLIGQILGQTVLAYFLTLLVSAQVESPLEKRIEQEVVNLSQSLQLEREGAFVGGLIKGEPILKTLGLLREGGPAINSQTLFEIGSITKVFTGILLADAVLQNKVQLDDPVTRYLPQDLVGEGSPLHKVTLKELATHSSGLPRLPSNLAIGVDPNDPYAHYREPQLHYYLKNLTSEEFGPKGEMVYSNLGAGLLGYLLGEIHQASYTELVQELIFQPLGMKDTFVSTPGFELPARVKARFAQGHADGEEVSAWHLYLAGAGAVVSTAEDLLKFASAHWNPETPKRLSAALTLAIKPQTLEYGLGWHQDEGKVSHHGRTGGFSSYFELDVAQKSVYLTLQNGAYSRAQREQKGDFKTVVGLWSGSLTESLPLLLNLQPDGTAVLYSLNQGSAPIPSGRSSFQEGTLEIEFPSVNGIFKARLEGKELIGDWVQGAAPQKLTLTHTDKLPKALEDSLKKRFPNDLAPLLGYWSGKIGGSSLFVYLEVQKIGSQYEAFFFSPTQHSQAISLSELSFQNETVALAVPSVKGSFSGKRKGGEITGHWRQGLPLILKLKHSEERPEAP